MNSGEMNGGIEALLKQHRVEQFLFLEARLIDERRFSEWEALWVDEGIYWVPGKTLTPTPRCR
jgi:3-phenylpropionate/cinnamic acid dioxygenase small subunit